MQAMSTSHSIQSRSRVPEGVPTGGQFAAERRGESTTSTLAQPPRALGVAEQRQAAREAFDANPLDLDPVHTRTILDQRREELAEARARVAELNAEYDRLALADDARREVLDRLRAAEDDLPTKRWAATSAAVRHAASSDEAMAEVLGEMRDQDPEHLRAVGLEIHPTILQQEAHRMRASIDSARDQGIGEGSHPVSQAEARRTLPAGTPVTRTYLQKAPAGVPSEVTIAKQNSYQQITQDSDGNEVVLGWAGTRTHRDAGGTIIVSSEHGVPFVAFRPETSA